MTEAILVGIVMAVVLIIVVLAVLSGVMLGSKITRDRPIFTGKEEEPYYATPADEIRAEQDRKARELNERM